MIIFGTQQYSYCSDIKARWSFDTYQIQIHRPFSEVLRQSIFYVSIETVLSFAHIVLTFDCNTYNANLGIRFSYFKRQIRKRTSVTLLPRLPYYPLWSNESFPPLPRRRRIKVKYESPLIFSRFGWETIIKNKKIDHLFDKCPRASTCLRTVICFANFRTRPFRSRQPHNPWPVRGGVCRPIWINLHALVRGILFFLLVPLKS